MIDAAPETDFEDAIIALATATGWMIHAERPAKIRPDPTTGRTRARTAVKGHVGYPDITAAHPQHGIILAELKSATGTLTDEQRDWLSTLANHDRPAAQILIEVWRPEDWPAIETAFRHGPHVYRAHHRKP